VRLGFKSILELAIPLTVLDWRPDDTGVFSVCMNQGKMEIERHPAGGAIRITIPGSEIDLKSWRV
jgi:hypothetical protein